MSSTEDFNVMLDRIHGIRISMGIHKDNKLAKRWVRYGDYRDWLIEGVTDHLAKEILELADAMESGERPKIKDEVMDVSNILDMLWDLLSLGDA